MRPMVDWVAILMVKLAHITAVANNMQITPPFAAGEGDSGVGSGGARHWGASQACRRVYSAE